MVGSLIVYLNCPFLLGDFTHCGVVISLMCDLQQTVTIELL